MLIADSSPISFQPPSYPYTHCSSQCQLFPFLFPLESPSIPFYPPLFYQFSPVMRLASSSQACLCWHVTLVSCPFSLDTPALKTHGGLVRHDRSATSLLHSPSFFVNAEYPVWKRSVSSGTWIVLPILSDGCCLCAQWKADHWAGLKVWLWAKMAGSRIEPEIVWWLKICSSGFTNRYCHGTNLRKCLSHSLTYLSRSLWNQSLGSGSSVKTSRWHSVSSSAYFRNSAYWPHLSTTPWMIY